MSNTSITCQIFILMLTHSSLIVRLPCCSVGQSQLIIFPGFILIFSTDFLPFSSVSHSFFILFVIPVSYYDSLTQTFLILINCNLDDFYQFQSSILSFPCVSFFPPIIINLVLPSTPLKFNFLMFFYWKQTLRLVTIPPQSFKKSKNNY